MQHRKCIKTAVDDLVDRDYWREIRLPQLTGGVAGLGVVWAVLANNYQWLHLHHGVRRLKSSNPIP